MRLILDAHKYPDKYAIVRSSSVCEEYEQIILAQRKEIRDLKKQLSQFTEMAAKIDLYGPLRAVLAGMELQRRKSTEHNETDH